jgi:acyl-coenzyme A thioesterase PaaI-like protein
LLGWKLLEIDPDVGTIRVEFEGRRVCQIPLELSRGASESDAHDTMGPAAMAFLDGAQTAQTLELRVNFMRPGENWPNFR